MSSITQFLEDDHQQCDGLFHRSEACVDAAQWDEAARLFQAFGAALQLHFTMEEEVLFPAFEQATGSSQGPTTVMRSEHVQLQRIVGEAAGALAARHADDFFAAAETLQIMMSQHNMKEESILYPMSDRMLGERRAQVLEEMQALGTDAAGAPA